LDIFEEIRRTERIGCSPYEVEQLSELKFRDFFASEMINEQENKASDMRIIRSVVKKILD
jgi:hypothetical protein